MAILNSWNLVNWFHVKSGWQKNLMSTSWFKIVEYTMWNFLNKASWNIHAWGDLVPSRDLCSLQNRKGWRPLNQDNGHTRQQNIVNAEQLHLPHTRWDLWKRIEVEIRFRKRDNNVVDFAQCKEKQFSVTQIFREINFWQTWVSNIVTLTILEALN